MTKKLARWIGYGHALKIKYFFQKPKPREIIVDICAACNASCPFCPRIYMPEERSKGYMDMDLFRFILAEAKREGIKNIRLYSTAEPTLHPKFDEIIELLKRDNFFVSVSTNASMLDRHTDTLMKVDILQYSIEGWDKESYEKYRVPLKFDKVYNNIKDFHAEKLKREIRPKISTNLLLTKKTDLKKYMQLWGDFVDNVKMHFMLEATVYENDRFVARKNEAIGDEYYTFAKQTKNFLCTYPFNILTVAYDGKIALCCNDFSASMDIGHIRDGISPVFQSPVLESIRNEFYTQKLNRCKGCAFFSLPQEKDREAVKKTIAELDYKHQEKISWEI